MDKGKFLMILIVCTVGIAVWAAMGKVATEVITTVKSSDSSNTEVIIDSMKVVRYVYTDEYKLHKNGVITINGSNYRYIGDYNVIGNYDKELFKITGSDAEVHPGDPEVIKFSDIIESRNKITVKYPFHKPQTFIIPEGFEGISSWNNSAIVINGVIIRGFGGGGAWFWLIVFGLIAIGTMIAAIRNICDGWQFSDSSVWGCILGSVLSWIPTIIFWCITH